MRENPVLNDILQSISLGKVELSRFTFLEPISIAHLSVASKQNNSIIDHSENRGNAATFLSRLNFFDYIEIPDIHGQNIYSSNNLNTIEVNEASNCNETVYERIQMILANSPQKNEETIDRLVAELITNIEMYAEYGVVVGQVISRVLHLAFVDRGPGIATHLKKSNSKYSSFSDGSLILESLKKGVTSGQGKGFGLWQTHEVLSRNNGLLKIRSGNQIVDCLTGKCYKAEYPWFGTSIELRYNLDNPVCFNEILGNQNNEVGNEFGF
tara:strand:+ start:12099 stop:12902 length:804 start_codon:yes stop_codon:yes gene_type:complete